MKWALPAREEPGPPAAEAFLVALERRQIEPIQPPHWLAEVAAVTARLAPEASERIVELLHSLKPRVDDRLETFQLARALAVHLRHHMFDTLYHGAALANDDASLVTADEAYFRKAGRVRSIVRLVDADPLRG